MKTEPPHWNQRQGLAGEALAKEFLRKQGFKILAERYRNPFGEIDLVALREDILLFVEVKARSGPDFGDPLEAVTPDKVRRLLRAACGFLIDFPDFQSGHFWELAAVAVRNYDGATEIEMVRILP